MTLAVLSDAEAILALQKLAFVTEAELYNDYSIPPLRQSLSEIREEFEQSVFFKYELDAKIVGSVRGYVEDETCFVNRLIVHHDYRRKGIAKALMFELEEYFCLKCKRFELFTGSLSLGNIHFYEKLGYGIYDYYILKPGLQLVYMQKVLG